MCYFNHFKPVCNILEVEWRMVERRGFEPGMTDQQDKTKPTELLEQQQNNLKSGSISDSKHDDPLLC